MIRIAVDDRLNGAALRVARVTAANLARHTGLEITASVFLGSGSAALIAPGDPRPHVLVPLLGTRPLDAVTRAQVATADALVAMSPTEASVIRSLVAATTPIVTVSGAGSRQDQVIHTENPLDAVEVEAFLEEAPEVAAALRALDVPLEPFRPAVITEAIIEGILVSGTRTDLDSTR